MISSRRGFLASLCLAPLVGRFLPKVQGYAPAVQPVVLGTYPGGEVLRLYHDRLWFSGPGHGLTDMIYLSRQPDQPGERPKGAA